MLGNFFVDGRIGLEFLVGGLHNFVEHWHFYFFIFFLVVLIDGFVQLANGLPHARVEVVFHAVVSSE